MAIDCAAQTKFPGAEEAAPGSLPVGETLRLAATGSGAAFGELPATYAMFDGQLTAHLQLTPQCYGGDAMPGEFVKCSAPSANSEHWLWAIVTPCTGGGKALWPLNVAFFTESMARTIDRWFAHTNKHPYKRPAHVWEKYGYNGVPWILARACPQLAKDTERRRRVGVVMSELAVLSSTPDQSFKSMVDYLGAIKTIPRLNRLACDLKELLEYKGLLDFSLYQTEILGFHQTNAALLMDDDERKAVFGHINRVCEGVTKTRHDPTWLAKSKVEWTSVEGWMDEFSLPAVLATDACQGVQQVAGRTCSPELFRLLKHLRRVMTGVEAC
ncbi:MAG: hypothetical protein ABFE08_03030 [Armatimonadia bacterium]